MTIEIPPPEAWKTSPWSLETPRGAVVFHGSRTLDAGLPHRCQGSASGWGGGNLSPLHGKDGNPRLPNVHVARRRLTRGWAPSASHRTGFPAPAAPVADTASDQPASLELLELLELLPATATGDLHA